MEGMNAGEKMDDDKEGFDENFHDDVMDALVRSNHKRFFSAAVSQVMHLLLQLRCVTNWTS